MRKVRYNLDPGLDKEEEENSTKKDLKSICQQDQETMQAGWELKNI